MKLEDILNEAVGVPSGIVEAANTVYDKVLGAIPEVLRSKPTEVDKNYKYPVIYHTFSVRIPDLNIGGVVPDERMLIQLEYFVVPKKVSPNYKSNIQGGGIDLNTHSSTDFKKFSIKSSGSNKISMAFKFALAKADTLEGAFKDQKNIIIKTIAHELKHFYDHTVSKGGRPVKGEMKYRSYMSNLSSNFANIPVIRDFFFNLYYTTAIENLVRGTEVYTGAMVDQISKKDFYKFLLSSEEYKRAKELQSWSLNDFKASLLASSDQIGKAIESNLSEYDPSHRTVDVFSKMSDEEKVDIILSIIFKICHNNYIKNVSDYFSNSNIKDPFDYIKSYNYSEDIVRDAQKINNYKMFFKVEQRKFNIIGDKLIRKMAKVHALLNEYKQKKNSSN